MMTANDLRKRARAIIKPEPPVEELPLYKECEETLEKYRIGTNMHSLCIQGVDTQMWTEVRVGAKDKQEDKRDIQRVRNALGKNGYYTDVYDNEYGTYLLICLDVKVVAIAAGLTFDSLTWELEEPCYGCPSCGNCDQDCCKYRLFLVLGTEEKEG